MRYVPKLESSQQLYDEEADAIKGKIVDRLILHGEPGITWILKLRR